ncbi:MAG: sulfurtransferase complex subunit TusD [Kangiellaceae bacterium]|nr:sulfurtransferase complex subunit TusD [Kangiellaceae bacterium]MCW9018129.1 sulfurtransferase complex subunit TusD [Kangiellaceae bacterium]
MSTKFSLLVTGSPTESQAHLSAIRFAKSVLSGGHTLSNVFFYQDAVNVANRFTLKPEDEAQLKEDWKAVAAQAQCELQLCVAAGNRRGIINHEEASQNGMDTNSIDDEFVVVGLGQLAANLAKNGQQFIHFK